MDAFRKRHAEAKQADDARNTLIEDLLQKVDDMQKTMDRNAFVMVLVDGDCMNFLNELVKQGMTGGDEAAKLLRRAVFEYLRYDKDFKHDNKIVIRVYANLRGLSKTYADMGVLPNTNSFAEFVVGFNKAHPLCDFVDAGNHKEAADTKLKEILSLYVYNVHCKQILFGASSDNAYASFLSSFFIDTDVSSRIRIVKGPPFSYEFKNIISRFKWTEFKNVFRSDLLVREPAQPYRRSQEIAQRTPAPLLSTTNNTLSMPWRLKRKADVPTTQAAIGKVDTPSCPDLIELASPKSPRTDEDSDGDDDEAVAELEHAQSPTSSTAASGQLTPPERVSGNPTAKDVEAVLVSCTNRRLKETPLSLDFGVVKRMVEQELGLPSDFWGKDEKDEWFSKSKNIIKMATEEWVHLTGNPPPKNATWMLRFVNNTYEAPSSGMRTNWQHKFGPGSVNASVHEPPSHESNAQPAAHSTTSRSSIHTIGLQQAGRPASDRIFQNSEGRRIDVPTTLRFNSFLINSIKDREPRLCNAHHLVHGCRDPVCRYDHDTKLSDDEFEALLGIARSQRCPQASDCTVVKCTRGHMCPNGTNCRFGDDCKFADLHGIDTTIAKEVMG